LNCEWSYTNLKIIIAILGLLATVGFVFFLLVRYL